MHETVRAQCSILTGYPNHVIEGLNFIKEVNQKKIGLEALLEECAEKIP